MPAKENGPGTRALLAIGQLPAGCIPVHSVGMGVNVVEPARKAPKALASDTLGP